jgi:hypothetical protein
MHSQPLPSNRESYRSGGCWLTERELRKNCSVLPHREQQSPTGGAASFARSLWLYSSCVRALEAHLLGEKKAVVSRSRCTCGRPSSLPQQDVHGRTLLQAHTTVPTRLCVARSPVGLPTPLSTLGSPLQALVWRRSAPPLSGPDLGH